MGECEEGVSGAGVQRYLYSDAEKERSESEGDVHFSLSF